MSSSTLRISHYRVEEELKRDSLGYFFRAVDEQLDRTVVLRVVRAGLVRHDAELTAMRNQIRANAKAAAHVSHPNLVTIYEFRSLAETDVVVMEFVAGDTLEAMRKAGRRWTVLDVARLLARLADALVAAHEAGLVHGNVNAANVRIRPDGRVKLLELGVAKLELLDERVPHEPADDVRGLARIGFEMLSLPVATDPPPGMTRRDPLIDPVTGRAQFGFLAPVFKRALGEGAGFETAGELRDAVLSAMDVATSRGSAGPELEGGFATHLFGPDKPAAEDELPADLRTLLPLGRGGERVAGPRLVLPPDLAERASHMDPDDFVDIRPAARFPKRTHPIFERFGPTFVIAALLVAALGLAAWFILRRPSPAGDRFASLDDGTAAPLGVTAPDTLSGGEGEAVVLPDSIPAPLAANTGTPNFGAWVRSRPAGTVIRALDTGETWRDTVELSIQAGDSVRLEFSRPGYVAQRHTFTGSRLSVALVPDSVSARFDANVAADVFLVGSSGEQRLGTTNFATVLPTGTHRIVFRSPGRPDWDTTASMPSAGQSYAIAKRDFGTVGSLMATVVATWARVSIDGGPARESPVRFDSLSVGRHIVTVSREGYETIVDTVLVQSGQIARRQYTLRR